MWWEKQHVILSQITLTIFFTAKWFPIFSLHFLQIMMNFARFKKQSNILSAVLNSYKAVRWKSLMLRRKTPVFPMQGLLEDRGVCSRKQISVSSSSLEMCPSYRAPPSPQIHAESTSPMSIFNWRVVTALTLIMGKDQHAVLSQNQLLWGQISWTKAVSLEISLHWDSFPGLGHDVLSIFWQNLSKQSYNMWSHGHSTEGHMQRTTCSICGITYGSDLYSTQQQLSSKN